MVARFHYDDAIFRRLVKDQLPSHEEKEVTSHIERCADCQAQLEAVSEADISWSDVRRFLNPQAMETSDLASSTAGPGQLTPSTDERPIEFLAPSDDPKSLGRFGRYEITEILGRGGMGVVMRGYDPALDRHSAIKVLAPELATNASARNRFAREAKSAAAVVHEHVVPIQTVDQERGLPYLVMPVVEGPSLEQRVAQSGPLAVVEILRIGKQIASGLAAAHAQGLVHRDVKPANILLENGVERVMITDFGLARAVDDATMTRSGVIAGTPQYMSPEQARGNDVDHRSDLFSLGSVLYCMCTGRSPFRAETMMGVLNRITNDTPRPVREINPDIPEWLCRVIAKLMSKQPDDRFASAREVADLLEECLAHVQQPTAVPLPASLATQSRGRRFFLLLRRSAGLVAMIAAFGFAVLGMVAWQAPTPPDISGRWIGEDRGQVVLKQRKPSKYEGTYTGDTEDKPGSIQLKWSRIERRYNGTWREGKDRFGEISLRLVDDEIRGAWTTSKGSRVNSGMPLLGDLAWKRAAKTQAVNTRMRVLGANGRPVADNAVIRGTEGYSGPNLPALSETPSHQGVISLGKLAAGRHWLLVNSSTVLRIELPVAEEIIEPSLPRYPNLIGKDLDVKVAVEGKDDVEFITIQIHNRTAETIQLTEANLQLITAVKDPSADARVMSPLWSKAADGEALPKTTIEPDQTATLRLNWADWVKHGFWFSRDGEVLTEPRFPELEAGKTWVRVTLGSARPVSVTHPDKIVASGDDNRVRPALAETTVPGTLGASADRSHDGSSPDAHAVDRNNPRGNVVRGGHSRFPRSVAQAYVSFALAGRFEAADKLMRDRYPRMITSEKLPSILDVSSLNIASCEVKHEDGQSSALAFSDTVKLKKNMPDGMDPRKNPANRPLFADEVRLVVYLTKDEADGWVVNYVDLDSEQGAENRRRRFLASTHGNDSGPASALLLSDAIYQFNQQQRQDAIGREQPLLTDDEVIASIRAARFDDVKKEMSEDEYKGLQAIAETRLIPVNWILEKQTRVTSKEGAAWTVWAVNLTHVRDDEICFTHVIRDRTLEYEPPPGQKEPDEPQTVPDWIPLADLIAEFNESTQPVKFGQPPLTVEEAVASLRRFLSQDHFREKQHFPSAVLDVVATMADTQTVPREAELDKLGVYSRNTSHFRNWEIAFRYPVGKGRHGLTLRHRYLSSSPIERIPDDDIAWGPKAEDGLQVGVHVVRAGEGPIPGEKFQTTFFFRNQTSQSTLTLEPLIAIVHADPGQRIRLHFRVPNTSDLERPALVTGPIDLTIGDTASDVGQAVTPTPKSVPDPEIDHPSVEPTSEQDDRQALVVVESADFGDTKSMMKLVELERNAKTSKLRLTYKKRPPSIGFVMFVNWGLYEVAKARGTEYFIPLTTESEPNGGIVFVAGFTNTRGASIHETFGEFYSRSEDDRRKEKIWSVSEWEFLCRAVTWNPPNDDSKAKAEIAAAQLAADRKDTPSEKHAVLAEAFAKSDSPHVKRQIIEMGKDVEASELESFLLEVLQDETDVRDRILAAMALAEHGTMESVKPLLDCAENDPEGAAGAGCFRCRTTARRDAYLALAEIGLRHPAERDRITAAVAALPVTTNDVRDPKAQTLYILTQDEKFLKPFLDRLRDEDPETRALGVRALRPFKLSYAPEQLVQALADSNPAVQADAARLLGEIGDPQMIPILIDATTSTGRDRRVRCNAIGSLGDMRATQAEPILRDLLTDESVQVIAAIALSRITGQRHPLVPEGYNLD